MRVDLVLPDGDVVSHHQYAGATPAAGDRVDTPWWPRPLVAVTPSWQFVQVGLEPSGRPTCTPHVTIHLKEAP